MFGRKQAKIDGLKMAFYTDAAEFGSHGKILVSSRRRGLDHDVVNFVFVGMVQPPSLTPSLMEYIWTEAKAQGFVPFEIVGALEVNEATPTAPTAAEVAESLPRPPGFRPTPDLEPARNSEAVNLQEFGRAPVTVYDPSKAANAEVPAFLRKQAGQLATA